MRQLPSLTIHLPPLRCWQPHWIDRLRTLLLRRHTRLRSLRVSVRQQQEEDGPSQLQRDMQDHLAWSLPLETELGTLFASLHSLAELSYSGCLVDPFFFLCAHACSDGDGVMGAQAIELVTCSSPHSVRG